MDGGERDEFLERVEAYLDDVLPPEDRRRMEEHLAGCAACAAEVEEYRRIRRLALAVPPVEIPDDLGYRIRRRLEAEPAFRARPRWRRRLAIVLPVTAAAAVVVIAVTIGRGPDRGAPLPPAGSTVVAAGRRPGAASPDPMIDGRMIDDWLAQAANAGPGDAARLAEEAREVRLLARARHAQRTARGDRLRWYRAVEDVLVQVENDPSSVFLAEEARNVVASARPR